MADRAQTSGTDVYYMSQTHKNMSQKVILEKLFFRPKYNTLPSQRVRKSKIIYTKK